MAPTVQEVFRGHAEEYTRRYGEKMLPSHRQALSDICACRTAEMGGHIKDCDDCGHRRYIYHSCTNRACPACHGDHAARWLERQARLLLPGRYFHLVFTVPATLRDLTRQHQIQALALLLRTAVDSLQSFSADERFAGGKLPVLAVLHTWTQALHWHPHVHCLVPGIAVRSNGTWRSTGRYLVPAKAVSRVFRALLLKRYRRAFPEMNSLRDPHTRGYVVWSRRCEEGPRNVLPYLAGYAFRGPLSDRSIEGMDGNHVTIRYHDRDTGLPARVRLAPLEFMRRYLQHVLPKGFHKVRYYGLWAPANRSKLKRLQVQLAGKARSLALYVAAILAQRPERIRRAAACPVCGSLRYYLVVSWPPGQPPPALPTARAPPSARHVGA